MLDNDKDHYNLYPLYGFASELKCLEKFYNKNTFHYKIRQFTPGTYSVFKLSSNVQSRWEPIIENLSYFQLSFPYSSKSKIDDSSFSKFYENIAYYVTAAVNKRCNTTERPVACLLSGGLDSSLIAALVSIILENKIKLSKHIVLVLKIPKT